MTNLSTFQSIIWFTAHKCGSVCCAEIIHKLAQETGITYIDYETDYWLRGESFKKIIIKHKKPTEFFNPVGCIYGPLREFYEEIPSMENYKVVLMLRDPRDVLTSLYFSMAYSHGAPEQLKKEMENVRKLALQTTIDDYVLQNSPGFLQTYNEYFQNCLGKSNVLVVKYEDMVNDFPAWLNQVINFCQIEVSENFLNSLVKEADFQVAEENISAHKRQVKPGDHRRKLKVKTIRKLNKKFQQILAELGYVSDSSSEELELSQLVLDRARMELSRSHSKLQQYQEQL